MRLFARIATIASFAVALPLALTTPAQAQDLFLTSGSYTANDTTYQLGNIYVGMDSGSSKTNGVGDPYVATLNVVTGAEMNYAHLYNTSLLNISGGITGQVLGYDSSIVNVTDGEVWSLVSYNNSAINVSGGSPITPGNTYGFFEVGSCDTSTVNISGGSGDHVFALDNSTANVSGGLINWIVSWDSSTVNVSGGQVNLLDAVESSTVNISGGLTVTADSRNSSTINITDGEVQFITSQDNGTINITGGSPVLPGNTDSFQEVASFDTSTVNISGGIGDRLFARHNSTANISGGQINVIFGWESSTVNISGGQINQLIGTDSSIFNLTGGTIGAGNISLSGNSILNIFGAGLALSSGISGSDASGNYVDYILYGTLAGGQSLDGVTFRDYNVSSVEDPYAGTGNLRFFATAAAPEPATFALLALGLPALGAGVSIIRRRKRGRLPR